MRIDVSTSGKFHSFDLARQMQDRDLLGKIYTGYPRIKLRAEGIPADKISSYPYFIAPLLALRSRGLPQSLLVREWEYINVVSFASWTERKVQNCDAFIAMSSAGLEAGLEVQRRGGVYICDRGSAHIRVQDELLREEHERWSFPYSAIDPRIVEREECEYEAADAVTVPSTFAKESFKKFCGEDTKVQAIPYGVDLSRFRPTGQPDGSEFSVLFVGRVTLQKGIPCRLQSFKQLRHPNKVLRIVGPFEREFLHEIHRRGLVPDRVEFLGSVPQPDLNRYFSTSDVLVLPSIQDGFGMVMAQAMACGCPVIASENTGAEDLFTHGLEGFVVPIRDSSALADKLQILADDGNLRSEMRVRAVERIKSLGGWEDYGTAMLHLLAELIEAKNALQG